MGRKGRIEITYFRRQTTVLYSDKQNAGSYGHPFQRDEAAQPPEAHPLLMEQHDHILSQTATQDDMQIASLAQRIDEVLHTENNHASLAQQSGLVGTGSSPKLSSRFVKLLKAILGVFRTSGHSRR
jgi:hypothetical protein